MAGVTTSNSRPASLSRDRLNISCDQLNIYCCTPTFKRLWPSSEQTPHEIKILVTDSCLHSSSTRLTALSSLISFITFTQILNGQLKFDSWFHLVGGCQKLSGPAASNCALSTAAWGSSALAGALLLWGQWARTSAQAAGRTWMWAGSRQAPAAGACCPLLPVHATQASASSCSLQAGSSARCWCALLCTASTGLPQHLPWLQTPSSPAAYTNLLVTQHIVSTRFQISCNPARNQMALSWTHSSLVFCQNRNLNFRSTTSLLTSLLHFNHYYYIHYHTVATPFLHIIMVIMAFYCHYNIYYYSIVFHYYTCYYISITHHYKVIITYHDYYSNNGVIITHHY